MRLKTKYRKSPSNPECIKGFVAVTVPRRLQGKRASWEVTGDQFLTVFIPYGG